MMCHLVNAQYYTSPAGGNSGRFFCPLAGQSAPTRLAIVHWVGCINTIKRLVYFLIFEKTTGFCPSENQCTFVCTGKCSNNNISLVMEMVVV